MSVARGAQHKNPLTGLTEVDETIRISEDAVHRFKEAAYKLSNFNTTTRATGQYSASRVAISNMTAQKLQQLVSTSEMCLLVYRRNFLVFILIFDSSTIV